MANTKFNFTTYEELFVYALRRLVALQRDSELVNLDNGLSLNQAGCEFSLHSMVRLVLQKADYFIDAINSNNYTSWTLKRRKDSDTIKGLPAPSNEEEKVFASFCGLMNSFPSEPNQKELFGIYVTSTKTGLYGKEAEQVLKWYEASKRPIATFFWRQDELFPIQSN